MSLEKQLPWRVGSTQAKALVSAPQHEEYCDLVRKQREGESCPSSVGSVPEMALPYSQLRREGGGSRGGVRGGGDG